MRVEKAAISSTLKVIVGKEFTGMRRIFVRIQGVTSGA